MNRDYKITALSSNIITINKLFILFLIVIFQLNCERKFASSFQAIFIADYSGTPGEIVNGTLAFLNKAAMDPVQSPI